MAATTDNTPRPIIRILLILYFNIGVITSQFSGWEDYISSWENEPEAKKMFPYGEEYYDWSLQEPALGADMDLDYTIPYHGRTYTNAFLSVSGHVEFSNEKPATFTPKHPKTEWPNADYPHSGDPPFLAPYIASFQLTWLTDDPGRLFWRRLDPDSESDDTRKEIAEGMLAHLSWEVQAHVLGTSGFHGLYGFVVTWSRMWYAGCYEPDCPVNTVQAALVTDGRYTYVVYNYYDLTWVGGQPQGYDPVDGVACQESCRPAQAGFNAGGAEAFHPLPHSNTDNIRTLAAIGRFVYGVHSFSIQRGGCTNQTNVDPIDWPLVLDPTHGSMLGGEPIYVSGPCFHPSITPTVHCMFGGILVEGSLVEGDYNKAICVSPPVTHIGHTAVQLSTDNAQTWPYTGYFFYEVPNLATPTLHLDQPHLWFGRDANMLAFSWNPMDLEDVAKTRINDTEPDPEHSIDVRLFAYFESEGEEGTSEELVEIGIFDEDIDNTGNFEFFVPDHMCQSAENCQWDVPLPVGLMEVRRTGSTATPRRLWSQPFPLGWYVNTAWETTQGTEWADEVCTVWLEREALDISWMDDLEVCPMSRSQAQTDMGHFIVSLDCNITSPVWPLCPRYPTDGSPGSNVICYDQVLPHTGRWSPASHCCYDSEGNLLYQGDSNYPGYGSPSAKVNPNSDPQATHGKMPMLSHFCWDRALEVLCCNWTTGPSICQTGYSKARATPDISTYTPPRLTSTYGDPHFLTYDGVEYTFNGRGEYWLLQIHDMEAALDNINIQARLEKPRNDTWGEILATVMTVVALQEGYADDTTVPTIEIAIALPPSTTDLILLVDSDPFDLTQDFSRYLEVPYRENTRKIVILNNEHTPYPDNRQSNMTVIFPSGITAQVAYQYGALHVLTGLPDRYKDMTGGLFGRWNDIMEDDLTTPTGHPIDYTLGNEHIHYSFGESWVINPIESRFTYRGAMSFYDYYDPHFMPHFEEPVLPPESSLTEEEVDEACGTNFVCRFDYKTTLSRNLAVTSAEMQSWSHEVVNMSAPVPACPYMDIDRSIRDVTHYLVGGEVTLLGCTGDYVLQGPTHYTCVDQGDGTASWQPEPSSWCKSSQEVDEEETLMIIAIVVPICVVVLAVALGVGGYYIHKNRKKKAMADRTAPSHHSNQSTRGSVPQSIDVAIVTPNLNPAGVPRPPHEPKLVSQGLQQGNTLAGSGALGSLDSFTSVQQIDTRLRSPSPQSSFNSSFGPDFTQSSAPAGYSSQPNPRYDRARSQSENQAQIQNHYNAVLSRSSEDFTSPTSQGFVPRMNDSHGSFNYQRDDGYTNLAYSHHNQSANSVQQPGQNLNHSRQPLAQSGQDIIGQSSHTTGANINHAPSIHSINTSNPNHAAQYSSQHSLNRQLQAPQYASQHSLNQQSQAPQYTSQHSLSRSHNGYVNAGMDGQPAPLSEYTQGAGSGHTEV